MVIVPTVLVLGAGASAHLGFPTGYGLRKRILERAKDQLEKKIYGDLDINDDTLREFIVAFRDSGQISIDRFLESRPRFLETGKKMIATALIEDEKPDRLFGHVTDPSTSNWYEQLFQWMKPDSPEGFGDNQLCVITFNYDRSLEQYLIRCLVNSYELTPENAYMQLQRLPIIHVHGSLGDLLPGSPSFRRYEERLDAEMILRAQSLIRIVHEGEDTLWTKTARKNLGKRSPAGGRGLTFSARRSQWIDRSR